MTRGVVYFNSGLGCLARLVVSLHSLRRHYAGPVTVVSTGDASHSFFREWPQVNDALRVSVVEAEFPDIPPGRNQVLLQKTAIHRFTPFDTTIFLDADTLVRGDVMELADLAEQFEFVVPRFADWTTGKRMIVRRIEAWRDIYPQHMHAALSFGPALNCGVFAFRRNSVFVRYWTGLVLPGRHTFIPDESGMQVLLHRYPHHIADQVFNVSCMHSDPGDPAARVIHYHGNKHCRLDRNKVPLYGGELWLSAFDEVCRQRIWGIDGWAPKGDRTLRRFLKTRETERPPAAAGELSNFVEGRTDHRKGDEHGPQS